MAKKNVHVVPNGSAWGIKIEDNEKLSKVFDTQGKAIDYGGTRAIDSAAELFIHNRNGQIRERNTYGYDPFPPKG